MRFRSILALLVLAASGCSPNSEKAVQATYESYRRALASEDLESLRGLLAKEKAGALDAPEAKQVLAILSRMAPEASEVTSIEVQGGKATVRVEGPMDGQTAKGTVSLVKEGGAWKILEENWQITMGAMGGDRAGFGAGRKPEQTKGWKAHDGAVTRIAFVPQGDRLVTMSYDDMKLRLWDRTSGNTIGQVLMKDRPTDMAMFPDGSRVVVADAYGNVHSWPIESDGFGEPTLFGGNAGRNPVRIAINHEGTLLVTSAYDQPMILWSVPENRQLDALPQSAARRGVAFSPKEPLVAGGGLDNTFALWSQKGGIFGWRKEIKIPKVSEQSDCWSVAFSPDGKRIVTGHMDSSITLWDVHERKQLHNFFVQNTSVHEVAWSPDGTVFASALENGKVYLWDADQGIEVAVLTGHHGAARSVAWSPAEWGLLASGDAEGELIFWE